MTYHHVGGVFLRARCTVTGQAQDARQNLGQTGSTGMFLKYYFLIEIIVIAIRRQNFAGMMNMTLFYVADPSYEGFIRTHHDGRGGACVEY